MSVRLTESQMTTLKSMVEMAEAFADQLYHIMTNHKLNIISGCDIRIEVQPNDHLCTKQIYVGKGESTPFGKITLMKGALEREYTPVGRNSPEYEVLFAREAVREAMERVLHKEKPLPPDGLWISIYDDPPVVDCGVSVNDSVAKQATNR